MVNNNEDIKTTQNKFFKSTKAGINSELRFLEEQRAAMNKKSVKTSRKQKMKKESLGYEAAASIKPESPNRGYSRTRLRPRNNAVNYKDTSNISICLEESISPDKRHSVVLLEKIDVSKINKKPIYVTVKHDDENTEVKKDKVYDFQFDINASGEKSTKGKRKKRVAKQPATTRKKKTDTLSRNNNNKGPKIPGRPSKKDQILIRDSKKVTDREKLESIHADIKDMEETGSNKSSEKHVHLIPIVIIKNSTDKQELDPLKSSIKNAKENRSEIPTDHGVAVLSPETLPPAEKIEEKKSRVRISSIETLAGDRKVSFKPNLSPLRQSTAKFNPFYSTQSLFRPRSTMIVNNMMEHSLLNKSLSPIKSDQKPLFDVASPWRPSLPTTFSSVKQIVQSTPQIKRNFQRSTQGFGSRINEDSENDENAQAKASPEAKTGGEKPRNPLGVRILNEENIQASSSKIMEQRSTREVNLRMPSVGLVRRPLGTALNYHENTKNLGFGDRLYISPRRNDKATIRQGFQGSQGLNNRNNLLLSEKRITEQTWQQRKVPVVNEEENLGPKEEERILRPSNLNTFSNMDEVPKSIATNTSHTIFGAAHSTPIVKTKIPKIQKEANIDNCFGFDEDCYSDDEISAIKLDGNKDTPVKKTFNRLKRRDLPGNENQRVARISLGEIKNTLYSRREKKFEKLEPIEETKKKKRMEADARTNGNNKRQKDDTKSKNVLQFSDTFDVLSEDEKLKEKDVSTDNEIALFADLEPVHFTKPARWSYTKRRERKQYESSDEDAEDLLDKEREVPILKKRRMAKVKKVDEKKIKEWVKSVNETFQEIDNFDLVVEKLP